MSGENQGEGLLCESAADGWASLRSSSIAARREHSAFALAANGCRIPRGRSVGMIRADDVARLFGVTASTILDDWRRDDVREMARRATFAGLASVLLACARSGLLQLGRRAAAGDLDALALLLSRLDSAGLLGGVLSLDALAESDARQVIGADVFADGGDAAADLGALLSSLVDGSLAAGVAGAGDAGDEPSATAGEPTGG